LSLVDYGDSVPSGYMVTEEEIEVRYFFLSSDVAVVHHRIGDYFYICIVLVVSNLIFMPLNTLYFDCYYLPFVSASGAERHE